METSALKPGDQAPDFSLPGSEDGDIRLSDFRGQKHVVLLFYPFAFSPGCSLQLPAYQVKKPIFDERQAQILAISTDSKWSARVFAQQLGVEFPLLSDYQREVSRRYGVLGPDGVNQRAVFVIDKQGLIRYIDITPSGEQPDQQEVLRVLEQLDETPAIS